MPNKTNEPSFRKCPRCDAETILGESGALSRVTRDEGAPVLICNRCGERESLYGRTVEDQIPLAAWPVDLETLTAEEGELLKRKRDSTLEWLEP